MHEHDFEDVRPYYDKEIPSALTRIASNPQFKQLLNYLFPEEQHEELGKLILKCSNKEEFQRDFMHPVINSILAKTADGITQTGVNNLSKNNGHVFIANHRDIILDSSILGLHLMENGYETCQITWGNNLMISPFVIDIGKVNGMITVFREGSPKEMLKNSQNLSAYIRHIVENNDSSVWIAQRKGRTKDGLDGTDVSILKMLILTGASDLINNLKKLNITPVSISYEWEPCDSMKVRELYMSENTEYVKMDGEDLVSIIGGVVSNKGGIHLSMGTPINDDLDGVNLNLRNNEILQEVTKVIDKQIHANYKLWPSNYLAVDLLEHTTKFSEKYNEATKAKLQSRLTKTFEQVDGDEDRIRELFLRLYANPVYNQL